MVKDSLRVSVIIPCRNEREHIRPFLADLECQTGIDGDWEIIIADGQSNDGTREILERHCAENPRVRVIDNPDRVVPTGLNRAIDEALAEIIVRMDVHTRYAPDYIATCIVTLERTGADNVGGPARTQASGRTQRAIAAAYASPFSVGNAHFHFAEYEGPVDTVTYGCWRRQTLKGLGGFDERLVRNQDDELNLRTIKAGGTIWQSPQIRSWYLPRKRFLDLFRQYYQYGFWKVAVIRKHGKPASLRHLVPGSFLLFLITTAILGFWWPVAWLAGGLVLAAYALFLAVGSVTIANEAGWDLLLLLPPAIATYHFAYGTGFLQGWFYWRGARSLSGMSRLSR